MTILQHLFHMKALLNSFHKAFISSEPKPDKYITRKENNKPISLINMDMEILKKILRNGI